jgi:hypothetical protein
MARIASKPLALALLLTALALPAQAQRITAPDFPPPRSGSALHDGLISNAQCIANCGFQRADCLLGVTRTAIAGNLAQRRTSCISAMHVCMERCDQQIDALMSRSP